MPRVKKRSILSGTRVEEAMRRQVISADKARSLSYCINRLIKHKAGAILITRDGGHPAGVLSKTDLISAYYAGLPKEMPAGDLADREIVSCYPDEPLEAAVKMMQHQGVHRVYVRGGDLEGITGILSYLDVVGLLYRYCRACKKSRALSRRVQEGGDIQRLLVRDVMSDTVIACQEQESLSRVIESLINHKCGAILVKDSSGRGLGVISKTDLVLAYQHDRPIETPAAAIMQQPVLACAQQDTLVAALQEMLLQDIQRLFVHGDDPEWVVGVLSLSDSARFRSGSCRACVSGRLIADE